jgi:hypothetical protein
MSRDFRKLRVFQIADELLLRVYRNSSGFLLRNDIRSRRNFVARHFRHPPTSLKDLRGGRRESIYTSSTLLPARRPKLAIWLTLPAALATSRKRGVGAGQSIYRTLRTAAGIARVARIDSLIRLKP